MDSYRKVFISRKDVSRKSKSELDEIPEYCVKLLRPLDFKKRRNFNEPMTPRELDNP